jgi:hypothetical protein
MLFKSLMMCHIDYCISIWGGATPALTKPLFTLQKKSICLVTQSTYNAHTEPLFHELNTLKWGCTTGNAATVAHSTKKTTSGKDSVIEGQPLLLFM